MAVRICAVHWLARPLGQATAVAVTDRHGPIAAFYLMRLGVVADTVAPTRPRVTINYRR